MPLYFFWMPTVPEAPKPNHGWQKKSKKSKIRRR